MTSFEHLKVSAEEAFADAQQLKVSKPEAAMAAIASGHEALASYFLAINDPRAAEEIRALLESELNRYRAFGTTVRTFPQHQYLIFALAIGDLELAKAIAQLPVDRGNWSSLDAYLTHALCTLLHVRQTFPEPRIEPTEAESRIVTALEALRRGEALQLENIAAFWRATRRKRYRFTLFEHSDMFSLAFKALSGTTGPAS